MGLRGNLLHVGSGNRPLPFWAQGANETTLDINPSYGPDIVASMTDMGDIGEYDIVYSSHCLEHVYPHECPQALSEMYRVLVDGGTAIVLVPDMEGVKPTHDIVYVCDEGPICGLDIIYGYAKAVESDPGMAHKNGFTMDSLKDEFQKAGFRKITGTKLLGSYSIMVTGAK